LKDELSRETTNDLIRATSFVVEFSMGNADCIRDGRGIGGIDHVYETNRTDVEAV